MSTTTVLAFDDPAIAARLAASTDAELDEAPFGVIAFDAQGHVRRYNRFESEAARFARESVVGQHVFIELAPCMNNYLVAGRFESARETGEPLDAVVPYVLTFRMRPTRVRLRLIDSSPGAEDSLRHILIDRANPGAA